MVGTLTEYSYNNKEKTLTIYGKKIVTYKGAKAVQLFKELIDVENINVSTL